jgi:serine/threonine-protein kinase
MGHPSPRPAAPRPEPPSSSGLRVKDLTRPEPFFLGRYLVVDEIGRGGMASVHLARVDGPGGFRRWAAVKRIHPHLVDNDRMVDLFLDEARTAAGIHHANVAQVLELGRDDDGYWLAMEYLHGEPLHEVIRRADRSRVRVGPALAARICADAALGLHAAHELVRRDGTPLGLVHRDVTPHNLFVTYDGHVKVVDFGIVKSADRLAADTSAGVLVGKLAYMSPEQANREPVDRRTDVFALGVVLWEMTTGRRLFRADSDLETLSQVMDCKVPRPSAIVPSYPPELEACVMGALARNRWDRWPTARDFARALERYLVHQGGLVGVEELSALMHTLFADRIRTREAHLAWAADLPAPAHAAEPDAARRPPAAPAPATPASLLEDDDDVPTTVGHLAFTPPPAPAAPAVDLGATVALPASFGPPSPTFHQHERPVLAPPPAPLAAPPQAVWPAPRPGPRVHVAIVVCLVLLGLLATGVAGALAVHVLG